METAVKREPIAVIGIGCRYPGAADKAAFWELLRQGRCSVTEVPADRYAVDRYHDPDGLMPGTTYSRHGGFLDQIRHFDAAFFGISKKEATAMDVQQRLLLEVAWEAVEDAGLTREGLAGVVTGVFVGASISDYGEVQLGELGRAHMNAYTLAGVALAMVANRISHAFDFQGPSIQVNTACSSSAVAIHLACASLWSGEAEMAVAGGVNAILRPGVTLAATSARMLSAEGKCRSFDARADGFVRSEGAGLIVLKPLSRALSDRDPIYAVIHGSGTAHTGARSEITSLSGQAQAEFIQRVCRLARVAPRDIQYVEAQGAATTVGDTIEAHAVGSAIGVARAPLGPLWLGSVKTNIGHAETAGGVAGVIKTALALHHGEIPPHLHWEAPNPDIPLDALGLCIPTSRVSWPRREDGRRCAGVNAYAVGGTSAFILLGGAEGLPVERGAAGARSPAVKESGWALVPLSARSAAALQGQKARLLGFLEEAGLDGARLRDLAYTLSVRRSHHPFRWAAVVESVESLRLALAGSAAPDATDPAAAPLLHARDEYLQKRMPAWDALSPEGECLRLPAYAWQRKLFDLAWWPREGAAQAASEAPPRPARVADGPGAGAGVGRREVTLQVEGVVVDALGLEPGQPLDRDQGLFDLGLTSLGAVDLASRLGVAFGRVVRPADLFHHKTLNELTGFLLEREPERRVTGGGRPAHGEPIAVVGMDCRFPGGASDPEAFWQLLREGRDAVGPLPRDRWDLEAYFSSEPALGKSYVREGAFLDGVDLFDAELFGISPREAEQMDPQQRLLLELAWSALERAGIAPAKLRNTQTGVFVATGSRDYASLLGVETVPERVDPHACLGNWGCVAAGRIAYVLGLQGPAMHVDTACSSSLLAVHLAAQSLRAGECDAALAGGVNLILSPLNPVSRCAFRAVSADGRCRTFDAGAQGYGQAEGAGLVVLRRLSDAQRDGDQILAVLRGSSVNHDGPTSGFTVPNGEAQEALIRRALENAGVAPRDVGYVEAHGTGTILGDPIEMSALARALDLRRGSRAPLLVGSVKTNIGHSEAAAGIAGFIKTVLALEHGEIPPHLHLETPNQHIPWDDLAVEVPKTRTPWPEGPRIAGVSSFGMSGTNVHVVLSEAPPVEGPREAAASERAHILPLSAKTEEGLHQLAGKYAEQLRAHPEIAIGDACFTAAVARGVDGVRTTLVAGGRDELLASLDQLTAGAPATSSRRRRSPKGRAAPVTAFLFTGQGAQYPGMGRRLHASQPVFRAAMDECVRLFEPHLGRPLDAIISPPEGDEACIHDTTYTQPALFALGYGLSALWRSWGVQPDLVLGHSIGELTAACVAGVFSLADAVRLVAARGRLMGALPRSGGMASLCADLACVERLLAPYQGRLSIAAENAPDQIVVSGEGEALESLLGAAAEQGIEATRLTVSHAFHSPLMEPMLEVFESVANSVTYRAPSMPLISNLSGRPAGAEVCQPRYWVDHVRGAVRFARGMAAIEELGATACIEMGPHPTLLGLGARCLPESSNLWLASLRRGQDDKRILAESLASLWVSGAHVDWEAYHRGSNRQRVALPTYPFQRRSYWAEPVELVQSGVVQPRADAVRVRSAGTFEASLKADEPQARRSILDDLREASPDARTGALADHVVALARRVLRLPKEDALALDTNLFDVGIDSMMGLELTGALEAALQVQVGGRFVSRHPTVEAMTRALSSLLVLEAPSPAAGSGPASAIVSKDARRRSWLVIARPRPAARLKLLCYPYAAGGAALFARWHRWVGDDVEVCALRAPGRESRSDEEPLTRIDAILDGMLEEVGGYLDRPYALFGYSLGGLVMYELARRLRAMKAPLAVRLMVAASSPPHCLKALRGEAEGDEAMLAFLRGNGLAAERVLDDQAMRRGALERLRADAAVLRQYRFDGSGPRVGCPISVFASAEDAIAPFEAMGRWAELTDGGFSLREMPGGHFFAHTHEEALQSAICLELDHHVFRYKRAEVVR